MTDFQMKPDAMDVAIHLALSSKQGRTALEIWDRCHGYPFKAVRERLIAMAKDGDVKVSIAGDPERPVREYRAWK